MRLQTCGRVVDARRRQGRIILWLACGHKISVDVPAGADLPDNWKVGGQVACHFCPDPTEEERRVEKSAAQLYKEAGEP